VDGRTPTLVVYEHGTAGTSRIRTEAASDMRELLIGGRRIADDTDTYVIADIGHDPWDDLERAGVLFRQAALAGAHAVALSAESLAALTGDTEPDGDPSEGWMARAGHRELCRAEYARAAELAAEVGLDLVPPVFDQDSLELLRDLGAEVSAVRTGPADLTNLPLLAAAAKLGRPMLVGVRGATVAQVRRAVETILPINSEVALLQCAEPHPRVAADLNLGGIVELLAEHAGLVIGFAGNGVCPEQSWIAYAVGARIIEKRIPPDREGGAGRRRPTLDPLGLVRYGGERRWGDGALPIGIGGGGCQ
jgi:N-acetylneuraminate synthase/sialic acid synthase